MIVLRARHDRVLRPEELIFSHQTLPPKLEYCSVVGEVVDVNGGVSTPQYSLRVGEIDDTEPVVGEDVSGSISSAGLLVLGASSSVDCSKSIKIEQSIRRKTL